VTSRKQLKQFWLSSLLKVHLYPSSPQSTCSSLASTDVMAEHTGPLLQYATAEALRLLIKPKTKMVDAAQAASRRAPGIMLAAEVLAAMEAAHSTTHPLIPAIVKEEVIGSVTPSTDSKLIVRVETWLMSCPHELKRCKSAAAALAVVAPIVKFSTQLRTTPLDAELVDACLSALKVKTGSKRKAEVLEDGDVHALARLLEQTLYAPKRRQPPTRLAARATPAPRLHVRAPVERFADREDEMDIMHKTARHPARLQARIPMLRAAGELRSSGMLAHVPMPRRRDARLIARACANRKRGRAAALARREGRTHRSLMGAW